MSLTYLERSGRRTSSKFLYIFVAVSKPIKMSAIAIFVLLFGKKNPPHLLCLLLLIHFLLPN